MSKPGLSLRASGEIHGRPPLILTFDIEDWHQLVYRRLGMPDWDRRGPALPRQVHAILSLLDELSGTATFFLLGVTARRYPELAAEIARCGHEIACHGDAHQPLYAQSPAGFRQDLDVACEHIGDITGERPVGYRAPLFSINRNTLWAYNILAERGFRYDSSQYDSPRIPHRIRQIPDFPYLLQLSSGRKICEFPVAVWHVPPFSLPIGGGSYWRLLPEDLLLHALRSLAEADMYPTLYSHPYEWDPQPLRPTLAATASARQRLIARQRSLLRNWRRGRVPALVRTFGAHFRLLSCAQASGALHCDATRWKSLSEEGVVV